MKKLSDGKETRKVMNGLSKKTAEGSQRTRTHLHENMFFNTHLKYTLKTLFILEREEDDDDDK